MSIQEALQLTDNWKQMLYGSCYSRVLSEDTCCACLKQQACRDGH